MKAMSRNEQLRCYKGSWATHEIMKTLLKNKQIYRKKNGSMVQNGEERDNDKNGNDNEDWNDNKGGNDNDKDGNDNEDCYCLWFKRLVASAVTRNCGSLVQLWVVRSA